MLVRELFFVGTFLILFILDLQWICELGYKPSRSKYARIDLFVLQVLMQLRKLNSYEPIQLIKEQFQHRQLLFV